MCQKSCSQDFVLSKVFFLEEILCLPDPSHLPSHFPFSASVGDWHRDNLHLGSFMKGAFMHAPHLCWSCTCQENQSVRMGMGDAHLMEDIISTMVQKCRSTALYPFSRVLHWTYCIGEKGKPQLLSATTCFLFVFRWDVLSYKRTWQGSWQNFSGGIIFSEWIT